MFAQKVIVMENSSHKEELRYRALAEAATAAAAGIGIELAAQKGLAAAVEYINLAAGALILWDESGEVKVKSVEAAHDEDRRILLETEDTLLAMLRKDFKLTAAYMELAGQPARAVFTLPIDVGGKQFGALIGIRLDKVRLHDFDDFLRALAAVLALAAYPGEAGAGATPAEVESKIKAERDTAIIELAVAINHEINNPLTALLGNLQLLMLKNQNLPEDIVARLKVIEESANQIREVTARLMKAAEAPSVAYTGSMRMIDLSGRKDAADKVGKPDDKREDDRKR
ncbi:MAG: histidine kinase dimerization/phospho-acceptor domain-containing protein [candidate division Zixibacteria bacterium]|nr:histidine kinase dimerization/phospho-acceptor domain-containing protein [candidate division Zixibacteria bacterium]